MACNNQEVVEDVEKVEEVQNVLLTIFPPEIILMIMKYLSTRDLIIFGLCFKDSLDCVKDTLR